MNTLSETQDTRPWWSYGHLWMVIGGPLVVVVASFVTLYLAIRTPDPVYADSGGEVDAMQARNHAATGTPVAPKAPAASAGESAPR
jgi:hypothetical protein